MLQSSDFCSVVVIVPVMNEELTIADVISDLQATLPRASIVVVDNNSCDNTAMIASTCLRSNDMLLHESRPGKGAAVRRALKFVEADFYCLIDGDGTYTANDLSRCLEVAILEHADMVVGNRLANDGYKTSNSRSGHGFGNWLITLLNKNWLSVDVDDALSGLRVISKPMIQGFACVKDGFQIESELNRLCARVLANVKNVPIQYGARPEGSSSKLQTASDGARIFAAIGNAVAVTFPSRVFGVGALVFFLGSAAFVSRPVLYLIEHGELTQNFTGSFVLAGTFATASCLIIATGYVVGLLDASVRNAEISAFMERSRLFWQIIRQNMTSQ